MKRIYFALVFALTMMLMSCVDDKTSITNGKAWVTFDVAAEQIGTRVYGDGVTANDLEYAIFEKDKYDAPLIENEIVGAFSGEAMQTSFSEKLAVGKSYVVLFWADAEQDPYDVDWENQTVKFNNPAALKSQDENLDAFFAKHEVKVAGPQTESVELRRPFAQLNIGTSDTEAAANAGMAVKQTEIKVRAYTTLKLMSGSVADATTLTYALADIPSGENATFTIKEKVYDHLSMNYLLVNEKELVSVEFTVNDGSTNVNTSTFAQVPVERNYKTFIIGELLTSPVNIDIIIIPDWMKPDHIYDGNIVVDQAEVETGKTGGDEVVTFTAKEAWTAQVVAGAMRADDSWCTVEPTSGNAGDAEITITTQPNDTGEDRSATVVIQAGESTQSITVTQYAVELPDEDEEENPVPNNEIWYTSTDGGVVTPSMLGTFGASITSNTYENGKGIIKFDGDVTEIGSIAFYDCSSLTSITIPESVTEIGSEAFYYCSSLTSITIPDSVTKIGGYAFFYCSSLTSITIPDSVAEIGDWAFLGCRSLTSITIPDSVTEIGDEAFGGCSNLKAFYGKFASEDNRCLIIDGVLNAFAPADLTSYTIPDSVTDIGQGAFYNCSSLTSITIPDSVTEIGGYAFSSCSSLTSVYCNPKTPPTAIKFYSSWDAFNDNASERKIYVPASSVEAYKAAEGWKDYADYIFADPSTEGDGDEESATPPSNEIWYTSTDGNIVTPNATEAFGAAITSNTYENDKGVITFDGDVTEIGDEAFMGCSSLTSVTIPDSVTKIGRKAFAVGYGSLTSVIIGNNVTSIGELAFSQCSNLTSITIPDSVTEIGRQAFFDCRSLTSITIPDSVTWIDECAFEACGNIKAFYGKFASEDNRCLIIDGVLNAFAPADLTSYTIPDSVTKIGYSAFYSCDNLTSITIPDSVTELGQSAFQYCINLTSITIPDSVTKMGGWVFDRCSNLTSVTIPDSLTEIPIVAFGYCSSLTSITIPESVTKIGERAFSDCISLTSVTIPSNVTKIEQASFYNCSSLASVHCKPTTPPSIGFFAFDNNAEGRKIYVPAGSLEAYKAQWSDWSIVDADHIFAEGDEEGEGDEEATTPANNEIWYTSTDGNIVTPSATDVFGANIVSNTYENGKGIIKFDGNVTKIGWGAFLNCYSLTSITIPNSVTYIEYGAFADCSSLTSITIPDSVTEIGQNAFLYCRSLTSITIPDSVTKIGSNAFYDCSSLTSITIPDSVTGIGMQAFSNCSSLTSITIPDSVTEIGYQAFWNCSSLKAFYGKFASEDNRCLIIDGVLNAFAPADLTSYTIPDSVTEIGYYAFADCSSLTSITIPDSVTVIGWGAFYGCRSLTSITIPDSVTEIGQVAFHSCSSLTSITIPDSVTEIGDYAFIYCSSLTSITIPDSVTDIGYEAFWACSSLTSVYCKSTTPPAVTKVNNVWEAFDYNAPERMIYVPASSVETYKTAEGWSEYADHIFAE